MLPRFWISQRRDGHSLGFYIHLPAARQEKEGKELQKYTWKQANFILCLVNWKLVSCSCVTVWPPIGRVIWSTGLCFLDTSSSQHQLRLYPVLFCYMIPRATCILFVVPLSLRKRLNPGLFCAGQKPTVELQGKKCCLTGVEWHSAPGRLFLCGCTIPHES